MDGSFERLAAELPRIQLALAELRLDGWLLYDLHARNGVAAGLLGRGDLTRRTFVLIPAVGEPTAIIHGIEETPWAEWRWRRHTYVGWRELAESLRATLAGCEVVAMEISPGDAVPPIDLVPAGVVELVSGSGVRVTSSGELITRFHSRWTQAGLAAHRRASNVLREVAGEAFAHAAAMVDRGDRMTEEALRDRVIDQLAARGCGVGAGSIVGTGANSADPHYEPGRDSAVLRRDDVLLIDLWAKEAEDAIYADQTWMGYLGARVPDRVAQVWSVVCEARDAAVDFVRTKAQAGEPVAGFEVDDVTRGVISGHGYGAAFIHRTGHSLDQDTHGMGPNIDNLETKEVRLLTEGVGFTIEPGIYLRGQFGVRSEINVYMDAGGPEVTTPTPQAEIFALLG